MKRSTKDDWRVSRKLGAIHSFVSRQSRFLLDDNARDAARGNVRRISALSTLESCLYYQDDGLLADLHKFTDVLIAELLIDSPIKQETVTTINEVSTRLIPAELASLLAIGIHELLENSIQHAFEAHSEANYINVSFKSSDSESSTDLRYRLQVADNGIGLPGNIDLEAPESPGLAIVRDISDQLSGSLSISTEAGTAVFLDFSYGVTSRVIN